MYGTKRYTSWGRYPTAKPRQIVRLTWLDQLPRLDAHEGTVLPFGLGRSYGDSCLNDGGTLLDTTALNRFIAFDRATGIIRCEAGVSFAQILNLVVPHGWFLPVSPGTKFVTLGGQSPMMYTAKTIIRMAPSGDTSPALNCCVPTVNA